MKSLYSNTVAANYFLKGKKTQMKTNIDLTHTYLCTLWPIQSKHQEITIPRLDQPDLRDKPTGIFSCVRRCAHSDYALMHLNSVAKSAISHIFVQIENSDVKVWRISVIVI